MNDLNSVLIDGTLIADPAEGFGWCTIYSVYNGFSTEFSLNTQNHNMIKRVDSLKKGDRIRAVGRLAVIQDSSYPRVIIMLEHLDKKGHVRP